MAFPFHYRSGEEIRLGDRIFYAGEPALVEHVVPPGTPECEGWQLSEGGVVVLTKAGMRYALETDEMELDHLEFKLCATDDPDKSWHRDWLGPQMGGREDGSWKRL
jgi:hypothetical protein